MTVYIGARTDAGKRDNNEDCVAVVRNTEVAMHADAILIVADGMGGRASGEHASAAAVDLIRETLENLLAVGEGVPPPYEDALATAMRRANARVYEMSRAKPGQKGMGTTCVAAIIGNGTACVAHVGDSRAYLLRDGILRRITEDHSYIQDQVRQGQLSDHDARVSRFKHVITKAIGIEATVKPDFHSQKLEEGDTILLCSDGLSGVVDEAGMIQILSRTLNAQAASVYLVDAAKRQGSRDNISNIVARFGGEPEPPMPPDLLPAAEAKPKVGVTRPRMRLPIRQIAIALVAIIVGGIVTAACVQRADRYFVHRSIARNKAAATNSAGSPPIVVSYDAPRMLLDKAVMGDVIAGSDAGVVVADFATGSLWSVNAIGQVKPAGTIPAAASGTLEATRFVATDESGRIYVDSPADAAIRRYSPTGTLEMKIGQGGLKNPQALWVARNGDIYVIDDHRLKLIHANSLPTGASGSARQGSP